MFFSQVLRSTAAISRSAVASKGASKVLLRASHGRLGEPWAITEAKRLVPTIFLWGASMAAVLGWPFAVKKIVHS